MKPWVRMPHVYEGRSYHKPDSKPYRFENSPSGLAEAIHLNCDSTDLDGQLTKSDPNCPYCNKRGIVCVGHLVNTHWGRPLLMEGFYDPLGQINKFRTCRSMTLDEVLRLQHKDGSRIEPITRQLRRVANLSRVRESNGGKPFVAVVEIKNRAGGPNMIRLLKDMMQAALNVHCRTKVKSAWTAPLDAARAAGFMVRYTKDHKPGM